MRKRKDLVNQTFGKLTVIKYTGLSQNNCSEYLCKCECGNEKLVLSGNLITGDTKSCGCLFKFKEGEANFNSLYSSYQKTAQRYNRIFKLSRDEFRELITSNCFYCDISPQRKRFAKGTNGPFYYNGIDRVDNSIGYEKQNCVPCCRKCNTDKGSITKNMIIKVYNFLTKVNTVR
jgi:hypothetical protein